MKPSASSSSWGVWKDSVPPLSGYLTLLSKIFLIVMVPLLILPFTNIPELPSGPITNGLMCLRWRRILGFFFG